MAKILLKVSPKTGEPTKKIGDTVIPVGKGKIDQEFDIRDRLATLIAKGNTLTPDDKAAIYGDLVTSIGKDKAQKVMNHAFIFNTRPDVQGLPISDKLRSFYSIGSNDPDVDALIKKSKSLGYGVIPGFRESSSSFNQLLSGRIPSPDVTAVPNTDLQRKIMLKVQGK